MRDRVIKTYSKTKRVEYIPEDEIDEILPSPMKERLREAARDIVCMDIDNTEDGHSSREPPFSPVEKKLNEPLNVSSASEDEENLNESQESQESGENKELEEALSCLQPNRMLNDTVVDFYMNHLLVRAKDIIRPQVHLFNTFLYEKLKSLPSGGAAASQLRWDKKVNIFDKNFLVIPVCDHAHWVLVVACFAGQEASNTRIQPCLILFDSLGFKYLRYFTEPIRKFLQQRWNNDRARTGRRDFMDRLAFKEYHALVPLQRNTYDCGVHLLHNFERFLEAPRTAYCRVLKNEPLNFSCDTGQKRREIKRQLVKGTSSEEWASLVKVIHL